MSSAHLGRALTLFGALIALVGLVILAMGHVAGSGGLPGDITIKRNGLTCVFPVVTSVILSILLTLGLNLLARICNR
jgi:hypothetical protein